MKKIKSILLAIKTYYIAAINACKKAFEYGNAKFWLVEYAELVALTRGLPNENEIMEGYEDQMNEYCGAKEAYDNAYRQADKIGRWFMKKLAKVIV